MGVSSTSDDDGDRTSNSAEADNTTVVDQCSVLNDIASDSEEIEIDGVTFELIDNDDNDDDDNANW